MEIIILADDMGNFCLDDQAIVTWIAQSDGSWKDQADGQVLAPHEFHVALGECTDPCAQSKCLSCQEAQLGGHYTLGDPDEPVSYTTCGRTQCNTEIAAVIDGARR